MGVYKEMASDASQIGVQIGKNASDRGKRVVLPTVPPYLALRNEYRRFNLLRVVVFTPQAQAHRAAHEAEPQSRCAPSSGDGPFEKTPSSAPSPTDGSSKATSSPS